MSIAKDFRYQVAVAWEGDRLTHVTSPEKPELTVATPPEFKNGVDGVWSPEDLLVASVASCYAVTLVAVAEKRCVPLHALRVTGTGHLTKRDDGRFGFVAIELTASIETEAGLDGRAQANRQARGAGMPDLAGTRDSGTRRPRRAAGRGACAGRVNRRVYIARPESPLRPHTAADRNP